MCSDVHGIIYAVILFVLYQVQQNNNMTTIVLMKKQWFSYADYNN